MVFDPSAPRIRVVGGASGPGRRKGHVGVESFEESRDAREAREAKRDVVGLTPAEAIELRELLEGQYADLGVSSVQGRIQDGLLRSALADVVTTKELVLHILEVEGGCDMQLERLVREVVGERERPGWRLVSAGKVTEKRATPSEARRAIIELRDVDQYGRGPFLEQDIRPTTCWRDLDDGFGTREPYQAHREWVRLVKRWDNSRPRVLTPQDRWRRADEELEAFCRGSMVAGSVEHSSAYEPSAFKARVPFRAQRALDEVSHDSREILRAVYSGSLRQGASVRHPHVFGDVLARIVEFAPTVRRLAGDQGYIAVLREKLDRQPEGAAARERWSADRASFVAKLKSELAIVLQVAVDEYRAARGPVK